MFPKQSVENLLLFAGEAPFLQNVLEAHVKSWLLQQNA